MQAESVLRLAHKFAVHHALEGYEGFLLQKELPVTQHRWVCYVACMQTCMLHGWLHCVLVHALFQPAVLKAQLLQQHSCMHAH